MALLDLNPDQLLSTTRAVRKRLDFARPVPGSVIRECVAMALQAPSGSNVVTMRFVVVRDEKKRRAIGGIYREVYARYKASPSYPGRPSGTPSETSHSSGWPVRPTISASTWGGAGAGARLQRGHRPDLGPRRAWQHPPGHVELHAGRPRPGAGHRLDVHASVREQDVADILGIPYGTVAQAVLTPLAYTKGTNFQPAARPDPDVVIHWDDW